MREKMSSLVDTITDLEIKKANQSNMIRELELQISKMHVEMRHLKSLNDGSAYRIQNLEIEAKIFKAKE